MATAKVKLTLDRLTASVCLDTPCAQADLRSVAALMLRAAEHLEARPLAVAGGPAVETADDEATYTAQPGYPELLAFARAYRDSPTAEFRLARLCDVALGKAGERAGG